MNPRLTVLALMISLLLPAAAQAGGGRYLIITPDQFADEVAPLADWKSRKGMLAHVATTSEVGYSTVEIRQYIEEAVTTWDLAPEYVLLVGDMNALPMAVLEGGYSDTYYGQADGDPFIEIHPGRLPATSAVQVETMVEKIIQYERYPTDDASYYLDAMMTIGEDWDDDDWLHYYGDSNWVQGLMMNVGYADVPIYTRGTTDNATATAEAFLEAGASYASYHGQISGTIGWYGFNITPAQLHNGPMLPIIVSLTCQTMGYNGGGGEQWMQAGSPGDLRGGVGFVGTTISCSYCAHWRSAIRRGFWGHIFEDTADEDVVTFGEAVEQGRLKYYDEFHSTNQYVAVNIYGDPELNLWTGLPQPMVISHPPAVPCGETEVRVCAVLEDGSPRPGIRVGLYGPDGGAHAWGITGDDGWTTMDVDTSHDAVLYVTATGRNMIPYEGEALVGDGSAAPADDDDTADDDTTDDDDDTDGDDDDSLVTEPNDTVEIGSGECQCTAAGGAGPLAAVPVLLAAAVVLRRRR